MSNSVLLFKSASVIPFRKPNKSKFATQSRNANVTLFRKPSKSKFAILSMNNSAQLSMNRYFFIQN